MPRLTNRAHGKRHGAVAMVVMRARWPIGSSPRSARSGRRGLRQAASSAIAREKALAIEASQHQSASVNGGRFAAAA